MRLRRTRTLFRLGIVVALASAAAACTKGGQFDPTTLLDNNMFDSKKPVVGQREPVFPGGVPGATTGIPQDLYKGYQPPPEQSADTGAAPTPIAPTAGQPPTVEAKVEPEPKRRPKKPRPKVARAPRTEINVGLSKRRAPQQEAQPAQTAWPAPPSTAAAQPSQSVWPAPPTTAAAQPSQSVWPAPPSTAAAQPSQSVWPNPPATGTQ